jgi:hypothetical protein
MKTTVSVLLALLLFASRMTAGELYGTITDGGKHIASGVKVEIAASGKVYPTETDKFGSYRVFVKEKGKCTMTLHFRDQSPTVGLVSYDNSTRYDWILETKDGKLSLRRR